MSPMMSDGPAMVLSPPQDHTFGQFPSALPFATTTGLPNSVPSKPSRKRSRDDAGFEEAMNAAPVAPAPTPAPKPVEEPIYGEGMVLLNPRTGLAVSAESQTGTWYEEKSEQSTAAAPPVSSRSQTGMSSDVQGRKSQRLDPTAPGLDDIALSTMQQRLQNTTDDNRSSPSHQEPLVDDATRLLGISWQRINVSDDDDMAPAVRGWKKYIDNQYSNYLQNCQILMKSRALNAFLVAAQPVAPAFGTVANSPAYYLFNDDLDQARLVGSTWETCVQNLQSSPIVFEGAETLQATDKRSDNGSMQAPLGTNTMEAGVPLLQSLSAQPQPVGNAGFGGLNGDVGTGMEVDS
ncbi:uncharacterized protein ASPGLDRAFT_44005 [Aspergillus glaucus CBS 516.65]|uniref:Uncharacterized protein n=1 Tax=Aspergillus glaucus CBS 516.65 TaxID=1160497 RepID=A0A1L9VU67_ASPGL|nr:hypothetical protein ASPGLDRAFT_44005 [Aspergillus glaucus CBS 516.65]OJJ87444.1 hypothetical protein ASPGLDRAFT_44005 [Aspergillus glaucus CBS 516.65]